MQLIERTRDLTPTMVKSMRFRIAAILAVTLCAVFSFTAGVSAQNVSTTGQIRGRITQADGSAVPSVVINARNSETGLQRTAVSDENGLYTVRLLPPGTYTVRTQVLGFANDSITNIQVAIGQTATANFRLVTEAVALAGIEVQAVRTGVDATDAAVIQLVSTQEIEELPALGRDFTDFINLSGLVSPDPGATTGGQFSIGGARASGTNIQIDGVDANNSFFGENRGGSRIPFVFSLESIREFQIIANGFDVEYGNYSGGIINVVTRGGTNETEGSVYANYRSDALTAGSFINDPNNPEIITDYEVQQFAGRVSGPIIRDKAFYLISADVQRRREPQIPITRSRFAPGTETENPEVYEAFPRFLEILEEQYGVANAGAGYAPFETSNDALTLFGRVDWNLNNDHRLSVRHNFSTYTNDNEWNGNFDFEYGLSRAEKLEDDSHSFVTELQSVLGDNTFNVLRFQYSTENRPRQGMDVRPTLTVAVPGLSNGLRYGGTFVSYNNELDESKFQLVNNFTQVMGDHTVKLGFNGMLQKFFNRFQNPGSRSQAAGEFRFANLDDFANFRPQSYFKPMQLGGGIATDEFEVSELAFYAQDEWLVSPKLTATFGLRYDRQEFLDDPMRVVDVERAFNWTTGIAPTDGDNISPRVGLAYDINGNGRQVLRAGAGYFYDRIPYVLGGNVLQADLPTVELYCGGSLLEGDPDAPPRPTSYADWNIDGTENPVACSGVGAAAAVPQYAFWSQDFEYPEIFKANLGYEGFLGERTTVSLDVIYSHMNKGFSVRDLNLRDMQFTLDNEGGRQVFVPAAVFDPTQANTLTSRRNTGFSNVFVNYNDARAQAVTLSLEAGHRFSDAFNLRASYTHTRAFDNITESCCTSSSFYSAPSVAVYGPNQLGAAGDKEFSWGFSDFSRAHTLIFSGFADLPFGVQLAGFWRVQSGRRYTPEVSGDINGDGVRFNERPFIFSPENLPLAPGGLPADSQRAIYAGLLANNDCVGDFEGQIIDRNTCKFPWTNLLDMRLTKSFGTFSGQRAELQLDMFNVTNGIGRLFCDEDKAAEEGTLTEGTCGWGRVTGVFGADRNIMQASGFDPATSQVLYRVSPNFGREDVLGDNLLLQFQAQIGVRYYF